MAEAKKRKKRRRTCKACGDVNFSPKGPLCINCRAFPKPLEDS